MPASAATSPAAGGDAAHALPAELVADYRRPRPTSAALFARARASMPGAETRAVTHYWPFPTVIESGSGAELVDVDGLGYIDVVNNYTSLIHGNAQPEAREAAGSALRRGTVFPALHESQILLAEEIVARVPAIELLRFTNSGSEASALALRLARCHTGRRSLTVAEGSYHGAVAPFTPGEPEVVLTPYNDVEALQRTITTATAAVFMEPFLGAGGVIAGDPAFLRAVQRRCREVGAVFVVDEIQSLRNAPRGMAHELGLEPDLITLAKIIGGGLPIGAVGGRESLLQLTSPLVAKRLDHAGTFNGNVAASAAGLASLRRLDAASIRRLNTDATHLASAIGSAGDAAGLPVTVTRAGSILCVHPGSGSVTSPQHARRAPHTRSALHLALMVGGVYTTPRGMINLSTALTALDLENVVAAYGEAFQRVASARTLDAEWEEAGR